MQQTIVRKIQKCLALMPIEKAWLFGSYSRGEETKKSDVDLLVRFDRGAAITLFQYAAIANALRKTLRRKVDLVEEGQLKEFARKDVERDKVLIYERKD
jgi:predicted nucleotidyltransferase